jgi:hypothetical protein
MTGRSCTAFEQMHVSRGNGTQDFRGNVAGHSGQEHEVPRLYPCPRHTRAYLGEWIDGGQRPGNPSNACTADHIESGLTHARYFGWLITAPLLTGVKRRTILNTGCHAVTLVDIALREYPYDAKAVFKANDT